MHDDRLDADLAQRLRAYESRIPDEEAPEPHAIRPRRGLGLPIFLAGAAGAAAAVTLAAVVLLNAVPSNVGEGSPTPSADASPSAEAPASPTPATESSPSVEPTSSVTIPPSSNWQEAAAFGDEGAIERAESVTRTGDGLIAVGTHYGVESMPHSGPVPQEGRVWHSADGRSWADVTPPGTFADSGLSHVYVTADGSLIALGVLAEASENATPMAWESADGRVWTPTSLGFPDHWTVERIARGARGYLALIRVAPDIFTAGDQGLWLSADGRAWEMVHVPSTTGEQFTDVGAGDDGFAVLGTRGVTNVFTVFAIASADGRQWVEATVPPDGTRVIAPRGGDWIAAGTVTSGPVLPPVPPRQDRVWSSANGLDWAEIGSIPLYPVALEADGTVVCSDVVVDLHVAGPWLVANAGAGYGLCNEGRIRTYGTQSISRDGRAWQALPFPASAASGGTGGPGTSITGAIAEGDMLILVGHSGPRTMFWFNEAP